MRSDRTKNGYLRRPKFTPLHKVLCRVCSKSIRPGRREEHAECQKQLEAEYSQGARNNAKGG